MQTSFIYPPPLCSLTCHLFTPSVLRITKWSPSECSQVALEAAGDQKRERRDHKRKCSGLSSSPPHSSVLFPQVPIPTPTPHSQPPASPPSASWQLALAPWPQPDPQCPVLMADPPALQLTVWSLGWQPGCSTSHYFSHCNSFPCDWRQLGCQAQPWLAVT